MPSNSEASNRRELFAFEPAQERLHPHDGAIVCQAILTRLRPHLVRAEVDAYSDYDRELPAEVREVETRITDVGRAQTRRRQDPRMAVVLDLLDVEHWEALLAYAAWSINADLWGPDDRDMGTFHDSSYSIVVALTTADVHVIGEPLQTLGRFVTLKEVNARRAADEQARRTARRASRAAFLRSLFRQP